MKPLLVRSGLRLRMPTVRKIGAVRFFFYSDEGHEPPHVHVQKDSDFAKFWLVSVSLARPGTWKVHELRRVQDIVHRPSTNSSEPGGNHEGRGIRWPSIDADLSVAGLMGGRRDSSKHAS